MKDQRIVLLGEVHDNGVQHALRLAALRTLIAGGARPAVAFEQFDRERQPDIDRARRERPRDADFLIAEAKGSPSWNWEYYRPFVALALEHDLPIVAANLSRVDAMKIATGASPLPSSSTSTPVFLRTHEQVIAKGHCDLLPAEALAGMAHAQIARDQTLALFATSPSATGRHPAGRKRPCTRRHRRAVLVDRGRARSHREHRHAGAKRRQHFRRSMSANSILGRHRKDRARRSLCRTAQAHERQPAFVNELTPGIASREPCR